MSLDEFQRALAAVVADPDLVWRIRRGDSTWAQVFDLDARESERLVEMAVDPGMEVMCSLYRSNRLTALVRTVPALVDALGERLADVASQFWVATPRTDMQFRSEGFAFCHFTRQQFPDDTELQAAATESEMFLAQRYSPGPRSD